MLIVFVELLDGEQEFFDRPADGFIWAKAREDERTNSVEYVAIGDTVTDEIIVYRGAALHGLLGTLNVTNWITG